MAIGNERDRKKYRSERNRVTKSILKIGRERATYRKEARAKENENYSMHRSLNRIYFLEIGVISFYELSHSIRLGARDISSVRDTQHK